MFGNIIACVMVQELKNELQRMVEVVFVTGGLLEGPLGVIHGILKRYPEEVSLFVDMFEQEQYAGNRALLALIILPHLAHPGAIEFLRSEEGWNDSAINEAAGQQVIRSRGLASETGL